MNSNIFRSKGYSFVTNPSKNIQPLQLLLKKPGNQAVQLHAHVLDLLVEKTYPLPAIQKNKQMVDYLFFKEAITMNLANDIHFLKNLFTIAGNSGIQINYENEVSIGLTKPEKNFLNILHLDQFIQTAQVNEQLSTFSSHLYNDAIYIIVETLVTKAFSITVSKKTGFEATLEADHTIAGGSIQGKDNKHIQEKIEYNGQVPIVVAVKACQLFYSTSLFRKGIFKLKEGKIDILKSEQLPLNFLTTDIHHNGTGIV